MKQITIDPADLISMTSMASLHPVVVDMVYADAAHPENIFKTALYKKDSQLWLHRDLASIVMAAAKQANHRYGARLVLKDGLRTIEAQQAMQETNIVKANPQWCAPGPHRLLSPPGAGGHPRGMAIDLTLCDLNGKEWNMGTAFDFLTTDMNNNPASRDYEELESHVIENRRILEALMTDAAKSMGFKLLPLPQEWWDFRFQAEHINQYAPLSDQDLPPEMRMCS